MRWPQFSLLTLAALVAFVAVASAALVYASQGWSTTLYSALVAWLAFALMAAIYRQTSVRAFWIGSSLWGWIYLALVFWPASDRQQFSAWYTMEIGSELATTRLAHWLYDNVLPKIRKLPQPQPSGGGGSFGVGGGGNFFFPQFGGGGGAPRDPMDQGMGGGMPVSISTGSPRSFPDEATFVRVAHAVFGWLISLFGGALGRYLYATRPPAA